MPLYPVRESKIESWCVAWARARGIVTAKQTSPVGIPDRVFYLPGGRPLVVEFKRPKKASRKHEEVQAWHRNTLRQAGYTCAHIDDENAFLSVACDVMGITRYKALALKVLSTE